VELSVPEGLHPVERTHTGAVHEELSPMGGDSTLEQGKTVRRKEQQRQHAMN